MVPSRGANLLDFDSISFDSNNTCGTNTRSIILDEYDSDGSSSATTLPSFETNLLQLSNHQFLREASTTTFEKRAKFAQKDGTRNFSSLTTANASFNLPPQQSQKQPNKSFNVNDVDIDEIYRNWKSSTNILQPTNNHQLDSIYQHVADNQRDENMKDTSEATVNSNPPFWGEAIGKDMSKLLETEITTVENSETSLVPYRSTNQIDNTGLFDSEQSMPTFVNDNATRPYDENTTIDMHNPSSTMVCDNDNPSADPINRWIQIHEGVQIETAQRAASAMHAWTSEDASMSSVSITENVSVVAAGPNILGSIAALAKQHGDDAKNSMGSSSDNSSHSNRIKTVSVLASAARARANALADDASSGTSSAKDTGMLMNKGGMMLWRKVQNCVVVGAGLVNSTNQPKQEP